MFRSHRHLEKTEYVRIGLDKPITIPGNNQHQVKTNYKFTLTDRDLTGITPTSGLISLSRQPRMAQQLRGTPGQRPLTAHFH